AWMALVLLRRQRRGSPISRSTLAWLLAQSWGREALEAAGIAVIGIGAFQLWQAFSGRLKRQLVRRRDLGALVPFAIPVGRFGYAVRGVVTAIIGWFLVRTALDADVSKFHEIGGALEVIHRMRFGSPLLVIAGVGLAAYGAYLGLLGFFRRPSRVGCFWYRDCRDAVYGSLCRVVPVDLEHLGGRRGISRARAGNRGRSGPHASGRDHGFSRRSPGGTGGCPSPRNPDRGGARAGDWRHDWIL